MTNLKEREDDEAESEFLRVLSVRPGAGQDAADDGKLREFQCAATADLVCSVMNPTRTILSVASALEVPAGELVQRVEAALGKGCKRERESGSG